MTSGYWLLDWIENQEIATLDQAEAVLAKDRRLRGLAKYAKSAQSEAFGPQVSANAIIGGRGLDLSGETADVNGAGLIKEFEQLFRKVWHYFDDVIVEGFAARRFLLMRRHKNYDLARTRAIAHIELVLHLRSIGAIDYLKFYQKPSSCLDHGDSDLLEEAGLSRIIDDADSIASELMKGRFDFVNHESHFHYGFTHPLVGEKVGEYWHDNDYHFLSDDLINISKRRAKRIIVDDLFRSFAAIMAADTWAARSLSVPLAISLPLGHAISSRHESIDPAQVAMEIGLPILQGVRVRDLIKLRVDEGEAFERFRSALKIALKERTANATMASSVISVSQEVLDDVITPALSDIQQRLDVARRTLARKSTANMAVGTTVILAGLLAGVPMVLPAGIALGLGVAGTHYSKFLDDKGSIELSDMYFLWKLQGSWSSSIDLR